VWDVCCGSAPVADVVGHARYAGVDACAAELGEAAARRPGAQVVLGDAITAEPPAPPAALTVAMALMLLPLEEFLARAAALLPHGAPLHAMVPTREHAGRTGYGTLLQLLGQTGHGYRQPLPPATVAAALRGGRLRAGGRRGRGLRPPVAPADVEQVVGSFYVRDDDGTGATAARDWLLARSREPDFVLDYPLRRIRAVRA
jgi:hypothetical protein